MTRHAPLTLSESLAEMQRWREDFAEQRRRQTNPMVLLSAVLAAAGAGSRVSTDGRRVLLTGADGRVVRMYECRGPIDAELIARDGGWWSVGTHHRALQLVAMVAARQNQQPRQEQQA